MLVVCPMPRAFRTTNPAGFGAGSEHELDDLVIGSGATCAEASHSKAYVGAIEIQTDALA
jgi:hypothetical protein